MTVTKQYLIKKLDQEEQERKEIKKEMKSIIKPYENRLTKATNRITQLRLRIKNKDNQ